MAELREPKNLREFPYHRIRVSCRWCPHRRGDYDIERMLARIGPQVSLDALLAAISASCPRPKPWGQRGPSQYLPWCRGVYDDLHNNRPPDRGLWP